MELTSSRLLSWGSVAFGYGAVIACLYLQRYWSAFGLEPFQYANVGDLALVGLAGFGVTLAALVAGLMAGSVIGEGMQRLPRWGAAGVFAGSILALATATFLVRHGIYIGLGVLTTMVAMLFAAKSSLISREAKEWGGLPILVGLLAYVPFAATHYGAHSATKVVEGRGWSATLASRSIAAEGGETMNYAGRLGQHYVFYVPESRTTILVHDSDALILHLVKQRPNRT